MKIINVVFKIFTFIVLIELITIIIRYFINNIWEMKIEMTEATLIIFGLVFICFVISIIFD